MKYLIQKSKNMILVEAYWNDTADKALVTELDNLLQDCSTRAEEFVRIADYAYLLQRMSNYIMHQNLMCGLVLHTEKRRSTI